MTLQKLPYLGDGSAERSPELFFCKYGLSPGSIIEVGNVAIPGVIPDTCIDLYEGPLREDARFYIPEQRYDNVISISTVEHFGMSIEEFDWRAPVQGLGNLVNWVKPDGFFYVSVPFGKPTPELKRKAGDYWAQFYPPQNMVTFMPFTGEYIREFRDQHSSWLRFLFMKRIDIANNLWAWCEESDVVDCEMLDDGASAILIITSKDLSLINVTDFPPLEFGRHQKSMRVSDRLFRAARSPRKWTEYTSRLLWRIKDKVRA